MKTTFDYGNGIKITIDHNGGLDMTQEPVSDDNYDVNCCECDECDDCSCNDYGCDSCCYDDCYDDYVDDNDYDDDDEQDEPVCPAEYADDELNNAYADIAELRAENTALHIKFDRLRNTLRRYYEVHSDGSYNEDFDDSYTAQECVDALADVVETW